MNQEEFNVAHNELTALTSTERRATWAKLDDELPELITLKSGAQFDPRSMMWSFQVGVTPIAMNFDALPVQVSPLILNLKRVLIHTFENNSPRYAQNFFFTFKHFSKFVVKKKNEPITEITESHVSGYIVGHALGDQLGRAGQLSALVKRWSALHYRGFSDAAVRLLTKTKKKGNVKGKAVMTLDPVDGPFTDYELQQIVSAINNAYADELIEAQFFYLAWLAILTGQRISQYCALKVKDLVRDVDEFGEIVYKIKIPKAKQRGEVIRESFLERSLVVQFGESLWDYAQNIKTNFPNLEADAPLFPSDVEHRDGYQIGEGFDAHWNSVELSNYFREALSAIAPISPRTMEPMSLAIGRFRDTLGTRAAQEGFGELIIAEILGHADTQNVKAYVAVIPEIAGRLDKLLGDDLSPIANAFMGKVLYNQSDATRGDDPSSEIKDYRHSKDRFGNCGTKYDCKFRAPIACYTCFSFEAWLDGPHEKLLEHLEKERERLLVTSGPRVAAVNDLTIAAIREVIIECNRTKKEMSEEMSSE